jgi:hypothetical protein
LVSVLLLLLSAAADSLGVLLEGKVMEPPAAPMRKRAAKRYQRLDGAQTEETSPANRRFLCPFGVVNDSVGSGEFFRRYFIAETFNGNFFFNIFVFKQSFTCPNEFS